MNKSSSPNTAPRGLKFLYGFTNWALFAAGLANLFIGTVAAFGENTSLAATSLTAALILLFAATIDRFESLKGLGIEAKTRQLDQKITQADDALQRLREITELTGAALIDLNSKMGRWDSVPSPRETIALASRIRKIMKDLGSDEGAIAKALRPWAETLCFDMAYTQTRPLDELLHERSRSLESERQKITQPIPADDQNYLQLTERIRSIGEFRSRLKNFYQLELEDYPEKFMEVFENVPQVEAKEVEPLRAQAAKFSPGMLSLKESQTLADTELWILELNKKKD